MGRRPCCSKVGLNRGAWSAQEDKILTDYVQTHGEGKWRDLPEKAGLKRCGKSCRLRWLNYLRPDIKRGNISEDEEDLMIRLHKLLGNRWSLIAGRLPGRTDNEIKNHWNTNLGKRASPSVSPQPDAREIPESLKRKTSAVGSTPLLAASAHGVIRTKAVRCTRPLLSTPENAPPMAPLADNDDGFLNFLGDFNVDEFMQGFREIDFPNDDNLSSATSSPLQQLFLIGGEVLEGCGGSPIQPSSTMDTSQASKQEEGLLWGRCSDGHGFPVELSPIFLPVSEDFYWN
ncbi:unnamed protein product [Spirodela intermedia]|uniref:Uncharacterized protein n=1 Tax=Spirodela intermedia TaxID=51605 RepID=A0A7I8KTV1_SPIIN|nr:unnamed protein product [Spirodela intermedia]